MHRSLGLISAVTVTLLVATVAHAEGQRPAAAGHGPVVGKVALLGGPGCTVQANGKSFPAAKDFPLLRTDGLTVPPGEFMVVSLANGYLVRIDEDLTVQVTDLANVDAPPTHESLTAQLDRLVTTEEKGRAERIAGAQARQTAARTVAPQMGPSAGSPPPPPSLQPAAPPPPPPAPMAEADKMPAPAPVLQPAPAYAPSPAKVVAKPTRREAAKPNPTVTIASANGIDPSVAQALLEALSARLHRCASVAHARSGEVSVQLSVARTGEVQTVSFKNEATQKLQACLRKELVRAHFEGGPSRIQASIALGQGGK